jgi:hypothetical protein
VRLIRATFDRPRRHAALWVGPLVVTVLFYRGWGLPRWGTWRPFVWRWGPVVVTWHDAGRRR